jgi:hypothetical protein
LPDGESELFLQKGLDIKLQTASDLPVGQISRDAQKGNISYSTV